MKGTLALLFLACALGLGAAHAKAVFVGIGNNEFAGDIPDIDAVIREWVPSIVAGFDQDQQILTTIAEGAALLDPQAPDVFMFYYSGHGGTTDDPDAAGETDMIIGTVDDRMAFNNHPVTDDQLTGALRAINRNYPNAAMLIVLDTCYAGQAIADSTDLASLNAYVIAAADKDHCAFDPSFVKLFFEAAFDATPPLPKDPREFGGDINRDGVLTLGELFAFEARLVPNRGENPIFGAFGSNHPDAVLATLPVPGVPEPSSMLMLASGIVLLLGIRTSRYRMP